MRTFTLILLAAAIVAVEPVAADRASSQVTAAEVRSVATDAGDVIGAVAATAGAALASAPVIGTRVSDDLVAAWVVALRRAPIMWVDAAPRQLRAADARLGAMGMPADTATVLVRAVDTAVGAAVRAVQTPDAAMRNLMEP